MTARAFLVGEGRVCANATSYRRATLATLPHGRGRVVSPAVGGRSVTIIGAPLDLGQAAVVWTCDRPRSGTRGLEERLASIGVPAVDQGNVVTSEPEALSVGDERARYLAEILDAWDASRRLANAVTTGTTPLVLGGDHSVAVGTLSGLAAAAGRPGACSGSTRTASSVPRRALPATCGPHSQASLSLAGDAFAHDALHAAVSTSRVTLVGVQCSTSGTRADPTHGSRVFTIGEIDRIGSSVRSPEALARVAGPGFVHVSLDLDISSRLHPAWGRPLPAG